MVYLVGAGPGDPGLLTVRGAKLLESADVVVYDALSSPALLGYCPRAKHIYVGKRANVHSLSQAEICDLLVRLGKENKRVVRLKGGDPFVFGRGGEECEALAEAGVRFEVIPGITAAIAAAAYAGIPVTHRDFNSSFTLITGHESEEARGSDDSMAVDWGAVAKLPCIGFYMGVKSLPTICARLMENGMSPNTPAATIQWGTTPQQQAVVATLADLPAAVAEAKVGSPAITIVGRVVELREKIKWFENRPLFGKTIAVTRTRQQASELSEQLAALGANVIEAPTIELTPSADSAAIDAALGESFDWIIFTSANGVAFAKERLLSLGLDARAFGTSRIAAIGSATAEAIRRDLCLRVDLCPERFVAEALADALRDAGEVAGKRFLLLRAEIARPILRERLQADGAAEVRDVAVYDTRLPDSLPQPLLDAMDANQIDWITFTSSSTARNFVQLIGPERRRQLDRISIASIGPITSATLRELGLDVTVEAKRYDIAGLVEALGVS
ncbi:MAG: uroporphyrinogen-III C-methyltransferase [Phycisphaerae bacterium]|nr:uroporphyrinogen-III C-methyltransferase [Phycisphaerae bacterium]